MCIILGNVNNVSKTRILVAKLEGGKRQLTVYANRIAMEGDAVVTDDFATSYDARQHQNILRFFGDEGGDDVTSASSAPSLRTVTAAVAAECTFRQTERRHMPQAYYTCLTCNQGSREGVCDVCASHCHKGHQLSPQKYGNFFCDCGADNPTCLGMRARGVQWKAPGSSGATTTAKSSQGAMILPVPNGKTCVPVDLSGYLDLFDDLDALFPKLNTQSRNNATTYSLSDGDMGALAVQQVGNFKVSVVPTLQDFDRLRLDVFNLDPEAQRLLSSFYRDGYGFMVCQLDAGANFHPIGYTHALINHRDLFVPTVHYHGGATNDVDWDHEIFVWGKRSPVLAHFLETRPRASTLPAINWAEHATPRAVDAPPGFTFSVSPSSLQGAARPIASKLNKALGSKGYIENYPCLYRLKVNSQYAYNHDTMLQC